MFELWVFEVWVSAELISSSCNVLSARYMIQFGEQREVHSSSSIIVSMGLGSTGWFRSLVTGALCMAGPDGSPELRALQAAGFPWEAQRLYHMVREPFPSRSTQTHLVFGRIDGEQPLRLTSQMLHYGVVFSDGVERDFLEFNSAMTAEVGIAERCGRLVQ